MLYICTYLSNHSKLLLIILSLTGFGLRNIKENILKVRLAKSYINVYSTQVVSNLEKRFLSLPLHILKTLYLYFLPSQKSEKFAETFRNVAFFGLQAICIIWKYIFTCFFFYIHKKKHRIYIILISNA